ncbi:MAG: ABC transporter ATP-binding protein [Oscillospiraceae bacterium]|nr:ABC transporter ATP-binding protein [Oscillospiraceae bacterium]
MNVIITENLSKTYDGGKEAVKNLTLTLEQGEVFGFLGPNGAGKTTAVKLLNGTVSHTTGSCRVFDIDPMTKPEELHQISGVLTEHAQMYDHMTGLDNLLFFGAVFGLSAGESKTRALGLLEELELFDAKDKRLSTYSTGMRQRLSLARAMIHKPKILFLDEPTSGLDPESILSVNRMIKNLAENEGVTIFLCTHQLRYAQEICCRYGLIDDGIMFANGTLDELRGLVSGGTTVKIKTDTDIHEIQVEDESEIPAIVKRIVNEGGNIYSVSTEKPSLEDVYFALTNKIDPARGGASA